LKVQFQRSRGRRPRENVVPLVNVVFLLLIFFLLAGTLRGPEAFPIEVPATTRGLPPGEAVRTLLLDRTGRLAVDGRIVTSDGLQDWLRAEAAPARQPIRVRADRRARADQLLPLLETLSVLGFDDVALVTRDAS
jgi:biopolymer transport protein ExbD